MSDPLDILGPERAARVKAIAGGTRISVPSDVDSPFNRARSLESRFGREIAILLVFHFAGRVIYVPRAETSAQVDIRKVARLTKRKKSAQEIARKLECSERAVYAARARAKARGLLPT
jgi:hypothetical protein